MNHSDLIELGAKHLTANHNACFLCLDTFHKYGERPDILAIVGRELWMVECKVSHSDLLANRNKSLLGIGLRRILLVTGGVLTDTDDVPDGWGVWHAVEDEAERPYISEVHDALYLDMGIEAWIQVVKLYSGDTRRLNRGKEGDGYDEVRAYLKRIDCPVMRSQIKLELDWKDADARAFSKAVSKGVVSNVRTWGGGYYEYRATERATA